MRCLAVLTILIMVADNQFLSEDKMKFVKFIKENYKGVCATVLLLLGLIPLLVGKTMFTQLGLFCLMWSGAVLFIGSIAKEKSMAEIKDFDKQTKKIVKDLRIRGSESEYFGLTNLTIIGKERKKLVKKSQKKYKTCYFISIFLAIICILCVF